MFESLYNYQTKSTWSINYQRRSFHLIKEQHTSIIHNTKLFHESSLTVLHVILCYIKTSKRTTFGNRFIERIIGKDKHICSLAVLHVILYYSCIKASKIITFENNFIERIIGKDKHICSDFDLQRGRRRKNEIRIKVRKKKVEIFFFFFLILIYLYNI